jgi:23S rRNA (pseudouridine1915-N3)-methyltransferase
VSKFLILAPSRCSNKDFESLASYFAKLIQPQVKLERIFFGEVKVKKDHPADVEIALKKEAQKIEELLKPDDRVILMSEHGPCKNTEQLSKGFEAWLRHGGRVVFIFGSARGWHRSLLKAGREQLSLSPMTTQHEMALVIWLEQLYRLTTIRSGKRYHY